MLAIIRGPSSSIAIDINASVEWTMSDLRQHGESKVFIPRNSAAWISTVINDDGGFFFDIPTSFGRWRGIADVPEYTDAGASITVRNVTHWMAIRNVGTRTFYGLTPGAIAKEAFRHGIQTAVPLTLGTILEAPPIMPNYEFRGQSVMDVLTDVSELSGQTWEIDDDFQFNWIPRQGNQYETWIIDDGKLLSNIKTSSLSDTYSEITETDEEGRKFTAFKYAPALWPQQQEIRLGRE